MATQPSVEGFWRQHRQLFLSLASQMRLEPRMAIDLMSGSNWADRLNRLLVNPLHLQHLSCPSNQRQKSIMEFHLPAASDRRGIPWAKKAKSLFSRQVRDGILPQAFGMAVRMPIAAHTIRWPMHQFRGQPSTMASPIPASSEPFPVRRADTTIRNSESHMILDFSAGKHVGLGMFGRHGTSPV